MNPPRAMERVFQIVRKEFLQIRRDPRLWRIIMVAPVVQLLVFGYAVSTDIRETRTFVVDYDRSHASRNLIDAFTASHYFRVVGRSDHTAAIMSALNSGDAVLGIEIPAGFSSDMESGTGATVQLLFDGTNSNLATIARGYAEQIVQNYGVAHASVPFPAVIELRDRAWFNPDLDSRDYNVPAVIGSIMLLVCLLLTALAVVREREIGTLEQLMVSPLRPIELVVGKTIPFAIIGLVNLAIVTAVAILWFNVPFRGSFGVILLASVLYLLSALGVGLFVSTISKTQQEAFMTSFLVFMPAILLSGFMFPVSSMPKLFQWLTLLNPLRHYLEIVRGVFLKGAGLQQLWSQHLALFLMGAFILSFAAARFQKRVG